MRLTKYQGENFTYKYININKDVGNDIDILNKLGQLEDDEEEHGIDLIVLFEVLKNGFYAKKIHTKQNIQIYHVEPEEFVITFGKVLGHFITIQELYFEDLDGVLDTTGKKWYPEDYGKTWALTKEELE